MNSPSGGELRSVTLTLSTACEHCAQPVPINGPVQVAHCPHCLRGTPVPDLYKVLCVAAAGWNPKSEFQYKSFKKPELECSKCSKEVSLLPHLARPAGEAPAITCTACGTAVPSYPAPAWLKQHHPTAIQVFGGDGEVAAEQGGVALRVDEEANKPVAMACPSCGGGLSITKDDARTAACKFCSAAVFLPEELWKQLHPVKTMQRWTLTYTGKLRSEEFDLMEQLHRMIDPEVKPVAPPYRCPQCAKENPARYDFCLGCGAARPVDGGQMSAGPPPEAAAGTGAVVSGRGSKTVLLAVVGGLVVLLVLGGAFFAFGSSQTAPAPAPAPAKPHAAQRR
jgi:hypothetical protein